MKRFTLISLISLIGLIGPIGPASAETLDVSKNQLREMIPHLENKDVEGGAVPGQLLVKFRSEPTITYESEIAIPIPFTSTRIQLRQAGFAVRGNRAATNVTKQLRVQAMRTLGQSGPAKQIALVVLPSGGDEQIAVDQYKNTSGIEFAEPNYLVSSLFTPNDPYFQRTTGQDYQWNLHTIRMPEAWDVPPQGGSPSVKVAVIDSGVAFATHTVDGTQYVQAPELAGVNFVAPKRFESLSGDCTTPLPTPISDDHPHDQTGHGTHIAGTIVQATNNAQHAAGIAFHTSMIPIKVLTACTSGPNTGGAGGSTSDVIAGINHAVASGAKVINMSIGTPSDSSLLHQAITAAVNAGAVVVAASGNDATRGASLPIVYPAKYPEVIAVGATRFDGMRAAYSQYGPELDLTVPGGQAVTDAAIAGDLTTIFICLESAQTPEEAALCVFLDQNHDTLPDGIVQQTIIPGNPTAFTSIPGTLLYGFRCLSASEGIDPSCGLYMGTSMATPHVSAAAALILSVNSNLTPAQAKDILTSTASKTAIPDYNQTEHGAGLLDVAAALVAASGGTITPPVSTPTPTGGPTLTPMPTPSVHPVSWASETKSAFFQADNLEIGANGKLLYPPASGITVHSDPGGPTYTTLEATWFDQGTEMRMNIYFRADGTDWWVDEIRTYGGAEPGKWIYYTSNTLAPLRAPLGTQITLPSLALTSDPGKPDTGFIHIQNLRIKTNLGTTSENFQLLVGDVNDSNTITIEDVSAVLSKYTDFKITVSDGTPVDVNADGFVTIEDVALVLLNYNDFSIPGEAP